MIKIIKDKKLNKLALEVYKKYPELFLEALDRISAVNVISGDLSNIFEVAYKLGLKNKSIVNIRLNDYATEFEVNYYIASTPELITRFLTKIMNLKDKE